MQTSSFHLRVDPWFILPVWMGFQGNCGSSSYKAGPPWVEGMEGAFPGVLCRATVQLQSECRWAAGNSQCVWLGRQEASCRGLGWEAFT